MAAASSFTALGILMTFFLVLLRVQRSLHIIVTKTSSDSKLVGEVLTLVVAVVIVVFSSYYSCCRPIIRTVACAVQALAAGNVRADHCSLLLDSGVVPTISHPHI